MKHSHRDKMKIYLHVTIPTSKENMVLPRTFRQKLKRTVRQTLDWAAWALLKKFTFRAYNYTERGYCNRGDIAIKLAIKELLQQGFHDYELEFVETEWGKLSKGALDDINRQADLFVIAGGGYWVFNEQGRLSPSFLADLPYFQEMACPLVVFGSGVNFNTPPVGLKLDLDAKLKNAFAEFDRRVDLLAVRSELTFNYLRSIGMEKPRLLCDPAMLLKADKMESRAGDTLTVGVNLAFHSPFAEEIFKNNLPIYIDLLRSIQKQFQPKFYYFIHSEEEFLVANLLKFAGIEIEVVDKHGAELTGAYGKLDVLLCQMMHSNILALNAGVPAMNIAYDSKNFGFNKLIGMEDYCVSVYNLDQKLVFDKMAELIANREALADKLVAQKKELEQSMDEFLHDLRNISVAYKSTGRYPHGLKIVAR